jgi:hypothetical protein
MRRPALYRPAFGPRPAAWAHPYAGVLAHAVFYNSGGTDPTPPAPPTPAPPTPAPPATPPAPTPAPPKDPALVSMAQTDLNKMLAKEKEQGRRSALRAIATTAGIDPDTLDLDQAGDLLKKAQDASRQQMSELERREADAAAAAEKAARESAAAAEMSRTASFQIALLSLGAPPAGLGDVTALLRNDLTTAGITEPTPEQISEYAGKLKERRPTDFTAAPAPGQPTPPPAPGGGPAAGGPPKPPAAKDDVKARALARAQQMGLAPKPAS